MAIYTDFFLATDDALRRAFPGWGETLPDARVVPPGTRRNPFTGQVAATRGGRTWPADPARPPQRDAPPPDLRGLDVLQMKSVDPLKLAQLLVAALHDELGPALDDCSRPGLVAPASTQGSLQLSRPPERLLELLLIASRDTAERDRVAAAWEAIVVADCASIPNASAASFETQRWTGQCVRILDGLAGLVRKRKPGESLYLLVTV